jgi:hypothetical protein
LEKGTQGKIWFRGTVQKTAVQCGFGECSETAEYRMLTEKRAARWRQNVDSLKELGERIGAEGKISFRGTV